jgi:hypothetical protein
MAGELTTPDWLAKRGCELRAGTEGRSWLVLLAGEPQYRLTPFPVAGKFGCQVVQTINGRRLDGKEVFATPQEAVRGGLEALRKALGW